ncbi:amidohydrolase [Phenylobacterium montanum]|uniref:Amidohydrolase n=1 Tax=Phenylobacterium montanum TaxID=2823693 RepID=A0A975IVJ6_9CAUL|nr:amidohydrolase [Caulobacter sp. S6]QUD88845.1 amidohydrolase [Caulobacter sp. S6]
MLPLRCTTALAALLLAGAASAAPADLIVKNGRIHTVDPARPEAQALAVSGGKIVYVGDEAGAAAFAGPKTQIEDLHGRRVLPGLVDAHIHPLDTVQFDTCDLKSQAMSLAELSAFVKDCVSRYHIAPGQWLNVEQWNFSNGNQPDPAHPTLRAALDQAAGDRPIQLKGNDGHHGGFNSAALALARNAKGQTVGFSKATLAGDFAAYGKLIGVDAAGEPNGGVNEDARSAMGLADVAVGNVQAVIAEPEKVMQVLNGDGITAVQDAMVTPSMYAFYDKLQARGTLTVRATLAQYYDPDAHRLADGRVDYDGLVAEALKVKAKYSANPLIRADAVKLFADGVLEGDPNAVPPTAPESPSLKPYLQPIFGKDAKGEMTVKGYVDLDSPACHAVQAAPQRYDDASAASDFLKANGFHPAQCFATSGKLQHDPEVIAEYLKRMHLAGFTLHVHAIGDRAIKTTIDAIEAARAADGNASRPDTIAHLQLPAPEDIARIGKDHLFVAFTYAWAYTDPEYDLSVIPFVDRVKDGSYAALHDPANDYERDAYPVRSIKAAGGVLAAGSDAPVDTRDPRPFINMQMAVTRAQPGLPALNPKESITLPEAIEAYTLGGARALGRQDEFGSLSLGKSADFIVLDQDILGVPIDKVGQTKVLQTWFMGRKVFERPATTQ